MTSIRQGLPDAPGMARGVETLRSLEAKLLKALVGVLPGAPLELLDAAGLFLMRSLREAKLRRLRVASVSSWLGLLLTFTTG